jgi:hypothetical protein
MKQIPLTKGKFVTLDEADFDFVNRWSWYAAYRNGKFTAERKQDDGRLIYMHREICRPKPGESITVRDGDWLNLRRSNLVVCTKAQHCQTQKKSTVITPADIAALMSDQTAHLKRRYVQIDKSFLLAIRLSARGGI